MYVSNGGNTTWEICEAKVAKGVLTLTTTMNLRPQQNIPLGSVSLKVVDDAHRQFSLIPIHSIMTPVHHKIYNDTITLSASTDSYSTWLLVLEDSIRVCHVKSLLSGKDRTAAAVHWYHRQYASYERAMNILEFGGSFTLHHVPRTNDVQGDESHTVSVWLQADEDDTALVFFPAGEDGLQRPPVPTAGRCKSESNAERLVGRGELGGVGSTPVTAASFNLDLETGLTLPFHRILGITKGTSEKVLKSNPNW